MTWALLWKSRMVFSLYQNVTKAIVFPEKSYISVLEQLVCMSVSLKARKSFLLPQRLDIMSKERAMKSESIHEERKSPSSLLQPRSITSHLRIPVSDVLKHANNTYTRGCAQRRGGLSHQAAAGLGCGTPSNLLMWHLAGVVDTLLCLFLVFISHKCFTPPC